ncbi:MAG: acetate--CoA ligase [DPANN group archaeon]|nr:acetate--CoA ligase [DPANN group archaeon]
MPQHKENDDDAITSMMHENRRFDPPKEMLDTAYIKSFEEYERLHKESIDNPETFWAEKAEMLHWTKKWDKVLRWDPKEVKCEWFSGGELNVCYNCIDRHLETKGDQQAIIWQGNEDDEVRTFTYKELHAEVCRFANVLKKHGLKKGDRICMYLPMVPELAIAMLACSRLGIIHSIVFGGFSAESLKDRINDSQARMLLTSDGGFHGPKKVPLKKNADKALEGTQTIEKVIVVQRTREDVEMREGRDLWWHDEMEGVTPTCEVEPMKAEDPLFILYTSGTTGKPKGVLHTTGGYLLYTALTFKYVFNYHEGDIYWCTADIGWITGHSYITYGPLANGATTLMFEGIPTYPDAGRFWQVVEKFKVNIFYTAPTAIRAVARFGDEFPDKYDLSSLKILGSVGEPINPEAWMWYHTVIGKGRCPIMDTWWQTETGGFLMTPLPCMSLKPGAAMRPFFGIDPVVLKEDGKEAKVNEGGNLVIRKPWPSMLRTVWGDHQRYIETYFSRFPGMYLTGDGARVDEEGDFWILGRLDDVINVSGHRIGTAEVESALVSHPMVAEAAVVPFPHDIKGQALYAFVTLDKGIDGSDDLVKELREHVSQEIGPIAKPDKIQFAESLPKTRSGKIMRRILKKIAAGEDDVGNMTTLANPEVVETLISDRR